MIAVGKHILISKVLEEKRGSLILTVSDEKNVFWKVESVGNQVQDIHAGDEIVLKVYGEQKITDDLYVTDIDQVCAKR